MKRILIVLAIVLAFTFGTHASIPNEIIEAYLSPGTTVKIDNIEQTFKDANGVTVYPINYNGTVYLPIRAIGNVMGKEVNWDNDTKTVYLGEMPNNFLTLYTGIWLDQMDIFEELINQLNIIFKAGVTLEEKNSAIDLFMDNHKKLKEQFIIISVINTSKYTSVEKEIHEAFYQMINAMCVSAEKDKLMLSDFLAGKDISEKYEDAEFYKYAAIDMAEEASNLINSKILNESI